MKIIVNQKDSSKVAVVTADSLILTDAQSALDLMATVRYECGCDKIVVNKLNVCDDLFDLKTGIAGEILQKYTNYRMKIAIVGDFSIYGSKSLKDFIYECNKGNDILFLATEEEAVDRLHNAV